MKQKKTAKKTSKKPVQKAAKKVVKQVVKKNTAKKASPKKMSKKPLVKKPIAKKTAVKKATVKKAVVKKAVVKKTIVKKPVVKKAVAKKAVAKKTVVKKVIAKTPTSKKTLIKKAVVKTPIIKKEKRVEIKKAVTPKTKEIVKKPAILIDKSPDTFSSSEKIRYSDKELQEFKVIILRKLESAKHDLILLTEAFTTKNDNDTNDTSPTFKVLEEGSNVLSKEENSQLAARQQKFIRDLESALLRIENKTYGICRITGKLIPKERLLIVPHATMSIEAKLNQQNNKG